MLKTIIVLSLASLLIPKCPAQENGNTANKNAASTQVTENVPRKFYQLTFTIRELESEQVINSRSYSMILRAGAERGSIRSGQKVPYSSSSGVNTQWQQIDVGVNIDCRKLEELNDQISLSILAEVSSVVMENHGGANLPSSVPIIRNNRWESIALLPIKQPTILFSADDPASKRKMQLLLTITPIRQ